MAVPLYKSRAGRQLVILIIIGIWVVGFFRTLSNFRWILLVPLAVLILLYLLEVIHAITVSTKTSEFFKTFMLQTAVPITALIVVCIMALAKTIKESAIITLFGLSLAYTTYVVGKRIKGEPISPTEDEAEAEA